MQCGLSLCVKGKCSVVCHCVFKRISAVWSVIVVLRVSAVWSVIVF